LYGGNSTDGLCATQGVCLIDQFSAQCQALERTVEGQMSFSIDASGLIFQCDETNTDGECSFLDQCYGSSAFPACNFVTLASSKVAANPNGLLLNTNPVGLEEQTYWHFYSDATCQQWEGSQGILNGPTQATSLMGSPTAPSDPNAGATPPTDGGLNSTTGTDGGMTTTCREAMACLFNPTGAGCLDLGVPLTSVTLYSSTENAGQDALACEDGTLSNCQLQDPNACVASTFYPGCYYKWSSAAQLLASPSTFITSYSMVDTQGGGVDAGMGDESTPYPTEEGETLPPGMEGTNGTMTPAEGDPATTSGARSSSFLVSTTILWVSVYWM